MYLLELAGEDDAFAAREAASACSAVEVVAPGLATARGVSDRLPGLAYTRGVSRLVGTCEPTVDAARALLDAASLDREPATCETSNGSVIGRDASRGTVAVRARSFEADTVAVRARDVRSLTGVSTSEAERALGDVLTARGFAVDLDDPDAELRVLFSEGRVPRSVRESRHDSRSQSEASRASEDGTERASSAERSSADRSSGARGEQRGTEGASGRARGETAHRRRESLDANGEERPVSGQRGGFTASTETSEVPDASDSRTGDDRETAEPSRGPREDGSEPRAVCAVGWLVAETVRNFGDRRPTDKPFFQPGSMDPILARAVANVAGARPGALLVDPMCGTGGILVEAGLVGADVLGVDAQRKMVRGARENFRHYLGGSPGSSDPATSQGDDRNSETEDDRVVVTEDDRVASPGNVAVVHGDATRLPLRDGAADGVVFDAPYGRQSKIANRSLDALVADALGEARRIAPRAVVVGDRSWADEATAVGWAVESTFRRRVHRSLDRHVLVLEPAE